MSEPNYSQHNAHGRSYDVNYSPDDGGYYWSDHVTNEVSERTYATRAECVISYTAWVTGQ